MEQLCDDSFWSPEKFGIYVTKTPITADTYIISTTLPLCLDTHMLPKDNVKMFTWTEDEHAKGSDKIVSCV